MIRFVLCPLLIAASVSASGGGEREFPPGEIMVEGAGRLPAAAHVRRTHLLGAIEIYSITVYVDGSVLDMARIASPDVAKVLRVEVSFEGDPGRPLPFDWRRELVPAVEAAATAHLRGIFAPVRQGVSCTIEILS
jgi:hypothetical protein